jgi:hypothetical protein
MPERLSYKVHPFVAAPGQRATGTGDSRYVNVLFERIPNDILKEHSIYAFKRPALNNDTQPTGTSTGRGVYAWGATSTLYSVFGNVIYRGTASTSQMNTSSGRVSFLEIPAYTGNQVLMITDGQDDYIFTSSHVSTLIDQGNATNYPTSSIPGLQYIDGYVVRGQTNNNYLRNARLNTVSSYSATDFLAVGSHAGTLQYVHMQKDQIIAFTKNRLEFFFNNGNPVGSPLLRIDQNTIEMGMASPESFGFSGESACFVSENSAEGDSGRSVYKISSLGKVSEIADPVVKRFLTAEGLSISSCSAWMERIGGQVVYCINLALANRSFAYIGEGLPWAEFQAAGGGKFNVVSATSLDGKVYLQDATNGRIYVASVSTYRDSGSDYTVTLQTGRSNFGTDKLKIEHEVSIVGDTTGGTLGVEVSDDDFQTWVSSEPIDMALTQKRSKRLGGFYERAHRFSYTGNSSFRVQAYATNIGTK